MMESKARQKPAGKRPKTANGRWLLLLAACLFLSLHGVNSKTEIVSRRALSRFTGETPTIPVHGLAAHPRIFGSAGGMPENVRVVTADPKAGSEANKTKEETATSVPEISGSIQPASATANWPTSASFFPQEESVFQSHKFAESTMTANARLETSPEFATTDFEGVPASSPTPSPPAFSRELSESGVASSAVETSTTTRSGGETTPAVSSYKLSSESHKLLAAVSAKSVGGETTIEVVGLSGLVTADEVLPSPSFAISEATTWHDKRDTFWSIGPSSSTTPRPDIRPTSVWDVRLSETESGDGTDLVVPSTTVDFGEPRQMTTATVAYVGLSTDRWSDEDVRLQPSSDSQVRKEEFGLPAGTVAGIVVASVGFVAIVAAVLGLFVFRRFRGIGAKSYDNKYNGDNCSYLDSLQESSEEMFSLDNDSFLNSLEAMTMENYWAEDRRSTRV